MRFTIFACCRHLSLGLVLLTPLVTCSVAAPVLGDDPPREKSDGKSTDTAPSKEDDVRDLRMAFMKSALAQYTIKVRDRKDVGKVGDLHSETAARETSASPVLAASLALRDIRAETERRVIAQALEQEGWIRTRAAHVLGISRRQLFDKIQQYGLHE